MHLTSSKSNLENIEFSNGTTDVTRTWHFGTPTKHQIDCFTRVLKGQISLATTVFPNKVKVRLPLKIERRRQFNRFIGNCRAAFWTHSPGVHCGMSAWIMPMALVTALVISSMFTKDRKAFHLFGSALTIPDSKSICLCQMVGHRFQHSKTIAMAELTMSLHSYRAGLL